MKNACTDKQKAAGMGTQEMYCLFYGGGKGCIGWRAAEQELDTKVMHGQIVFVIDFF